MSTHDNDADDVKNPPKTKMPVHMPKPDRVKPTRITDSGRDALTPPAARKDEHVVR